MGNYYGTLGYTNLGRQNQTKKMYGDVIMVGTVADSAKWSFQVDKWVEHSNTGRLIVYIVPAKFCFMRYINDPH